MKVLTITLSLFFCLWLWSCGSNTNPPGNINTPASFPDTIQFSTAGMRVITSFINRKAGTMSTLYGNPLALQQVLGSNKGLAGGEIFTLVTWQEQPDDHWFGARIPGNLQSMEVLKTHSDGATVTFDYTRYEGKALVLNSDTLHNSERIKFILGQQPSVMP